VYKIRNSVVANIYATFGLRKFIFKKQEEGDKGYRQIALISILKERSAMKMD